MSDLKTKRLVVLWQHEVIEAAKFLKQSKDDPTYDNALNALNACYLALKGHC